jgi:hypothetical protein
VRTSSNIYVLSEIGNEKCCVGKEDELGYGTEEWVTYILITLSKLAKEKHSEKCPRSQNQPTLYESIVNKERKQRLGSNQGRFNDKSS